MNVQVCSICFDVVQVWKFREPQERICIGRILPVISLINLVRCSVLLQTNKRMNNYIPRDWDTSIV